ncbi:MAG: CpaF family protein, partial [Acetatifactor sp.]|nr:CpaF family protein [Acetatifactor sp.]
MEYGELKRNLKNAIQERMDYGRDYSDEEVDDLIDETMLGQEELRLCPVDVRRRLKRELFHSLRRLDILQSFVDDASVTEIM